MFGKLLTNRERIQVKYKFDKTANILGCIVTKNLTAIENKEIIYSLGTQVDVVQFDLEAKKILQNRRDCGQQREFGQTAEQWMRRQTRHQPELIFQVLKQLLRQIQNAVCHHQLFLSLFLVLHSQKQVYLFGDQGRRIAVFFVDFHAEVNQLCQENPKNSAPHNQIPVAEMIEKMLCILEQLNRKLWMR